MMRIQACLLLALLAAGCSNTPGDRTWYQSLANENARRQYEPGRDINREPPPPSFDAYEQERRRLRENQAK
ncbi:MAG: hypothetical protein L6Q69_14525 [Zoogloea sp.]|nr:hypothetical protein [Zoogloea sp.]